MAVSGNLVYVANSGTGDANYTGFRLGFNGRLFPIPGSTVALAASAAPGDVLFNGTGTKLAGTEVGTSVIDSFTVGFDGRLTAAPGSPFPAQGLGPFGSEFRPTNPDQLFVSNAHNVGAGAGTVSAFTRLLQRDADLDRGLPVRGPPDRPLLGGDHPRRPVPVHREHRIRRDLPLPDRPGRHADPARQHPGRRHRRRRRGRCPAEPRRRDLYVDESRIGEVGAFAVNGGSLTELGTSPFALPAGATPAGIVVN